MEQEQQQEPEGNVVHIENFRKGLKIIVASTKQPVNELLGVANYIKKHYFKDLK